MLQRLMLSILLHLIPFVSGRCSDPTVTDINMSNLGLSEINESLFQNCNPQAYSLDLSGNKITLINATAFASYDDRIHKYIPLFYQLETLNLNDNKIISVDPNAFKYTKVLNTLYIRDNQLKVIESGMFDLIGDTLVTLVMSNNQISSIGMSVFHTNIRKLRYVDLSHNKMTYMEAWPYIPPSIVVFNLSNNDVNKFTNHLNWTYDLTEPYFTYVDLMYNNFTEWDNEWFWRYQNHKGNYVFELNNYRLKLTNNPWNCDCHMYYIISTIQESFYRFPQSEFIHIECEHPANLRKKRIIDVDLSTFVCDSKVDFPFG